MSTSLVALDTTWGQRFLAPQLPASQQYHPELDPAIGSIIPLPRVDAFGNPITFGNDNVLIFAGGCTSCSLNAIDPRRTSPLPNQRYIFIYDVAPTELPAWAMSLPERVSVVADKGGVLGKRVNAFWKPRFVRVDGSGKIQAESDNFSGTPEYLRRSEVHD